MLIHTTSQASTINNLLSEKSRQAIVFKGDCIEAIDAMADDSIDLVFTSPPYSLGKPYESSRQLDTFIQLHEELLPKLQRILKPGGSLCLQIGTHISKGICTPLDAIIINIMRESKEMLLRNRVIWEVSHGYHSRNRLSGRHETILWYTKGSDYAFNLDAIRIPQKYPGKVYSRGKNKGKLSGNPLGKNPGDVWTIPNIKANHIEKTEHPCQFPVALPQRFIRALARSDSLVFDPFMGSGSTGVAALLEGMRFLGCELFEQYIPIAVQRMEDTLDGTVKVRPWDRPVQEPNLSTKVAQKPEHFAS